MGDGLMMVEFEYPNDKFRVMQDGPWHFDKALLLMKDFDGKRQVKDIHLKKALFWVRIHDLPLMARSEFIGREVRKTLGNVKEVDLDFGEFEWGEVYVHSG